MTSLTTAYDPAWDALFGEFRLIPNLKPRPGQNPARSQRRPVQHSSGSGVPAGMIANALLTNQAMVKVVRGGSVTASGRLGGQLSYITRKGTVEMERGDTGELTHGVDALRDVQDEWAEDWARMDARVTSYTYHVILSYPKHTDREAAKQAARRFGERLTNGEYGDRYKYVMAHHDDTGHPHTHLVISRAGALGKTLQLSRYGITPQNLRELQVETAQDVGIALTATSRFSRNLGPEPKAARGFMRGATAGICASGQSACDAAVSLSMAMASSGRSRRTSFRPSKISAIPNTPPLAKHSGRIRPVSNRAFSQRNTQGVPRPLGPLVKLYSAQLQSCCRAGFSDQRKST
ncbi:MAG: relaxase/mobilization nuclease domain-containing protein [Pseudomonadota bacterium]